MGVWNQLGFQDSNSRVMEELTFFHDFVMVTLVSILGFVVVMALQALTGRLLALKMLQAQGLECVWTLVPAVILVKLAAPSLMLLYLTDDSSNSSMTIKTVGHQWYWEYEYSDLWSNGKNMSFDSYMETTIPRLLVTDNSLVVPTTTPIQMLVTSADVLHSWTVPSLGTKVDACPGRLNQIVLESLRNGKFFGQCSEICGANHSFMPINIEVLNYLDFQEWAAAHLE